MNDYIKRADATEAVWRILNGMGISQKHNDRLVEEVDAVLDEYPAADVRPVVRGKWTLNKDGSGTCSECGRTQKNCWDLDNWDNFCHFCGADMREKTDG